MKGVTPNYTLVWGIQVGRWDGKVSCLLNTEEDDNAIAITVGFTVGSHASDTDMYMGDKKNFAAENLPRKPPEQLLYNGTGNSYEYEHMEIPKQPGRLEAD